MSIATLTYRGLLSVSGPDRASFLKGLCTARIDDLSAEAARREFHKLHYGAFLRPQGKMIADCLLHAVDADTIRLDVPLDVRDELFSKLNMYKLRAKVTIEKIDAAVCAALDELPEGYMADPRSLITGGLYGRAYGHAHTQAASDGDWQTFRHALGLAEGGADFGPDELYAIDANLDVLNAIDFHKGCYVGQELTSRMKRRGQIKTRILPLRHPGRLEKGAEILTGERKIGEVLSGGRGLSLGLMRLDRLGGDATCQGQSVAIMTPDWLREVLPDQDTPKENQ
ncbi:folate-binding protein [Asticcacaulis sp. EMRT-3]|uniref:CAF17-like 4Fe-4S cluster assembly/insertion protein YgfZ n=1 Tax=Asticcacaulis sp. EMRT-3 TaxID=3040349 RepID=UPI0024AED321|nr:folate-binding protein [Asticcacaulis sp. EMRT-3]MDI7774894.1 folate-binding protein [Asticcacaulis sp. EMRT-3]